MANYAEGAQAPYEIYCNHCNVTHPAGTKTCVHCGQRLGRGRGRIRPVGIEALVAGRPAETAETAEEEVTARGRLSPTAIIWLVLALGGALYRSCTAP